MKYTTFRNSLLAGGALTLFAVIGGSVYVGKQSAESANRQVAAAGHPAKVTLPAAAEPKLLPPTPTDPSLTAPTPRGVAAIAATAAPERAAVPAARAALASKTPLRELDRELLQLYAQGSMPAKLKDVFPSRPYKVNLYVEGGLLVRAKVDLNRNGKWDEKWSFEAAAQAPVIKRQVSPTDDDTSYPLTYKVVDKGWVQK